MVDYREQILSNWEIDDDTFERLCGYYGVVTQTKCYEDKRCHRPMCPRCLLHTLMKHLTFIEVKARTSEYIYIKDTSTYQIHGNMSPKLWAKFKDQGKYHKELDFVCWSLRYGVWHRCLQDGPPKILYGYVGAWVTNTRLLENSSLRVTTVCNSWDRSARRLDTRVNINEFTKDQVEDAQICYLNECSDDGPDDFLNSDYVKALDVIEATKWLAARTNTAATYKIKI